MTGNDMEKEESINSRKLDNLGRYGKSGKYRKTEISNYGPKGREFESSNAHDEKGI